MRRQPTRGIFASRPEKFGRLTPLTHVGGEIASKSNGSLGRTTQPTTNQFDVPLITESQRATFPDYMYHHSPIERNSLPTKKTRWE